LNSMISIEFNDHSILADIKRQFLIYHVQENYINSTVVVIVNLGSFNSLYGGSSADKPCMDTSSSLIPSHSLPRYSDYFSSSSSSSSLSLSCTTSMEYTLTPSSASSSPACFTISIVSAFSSCGFARAF
jgi:hypothetical protein